VYAIRLVASAVDNKDEEEIDSSPPDNNTVLPFFPYFTPFIVPSRSMLSNKTIGLYILYDSVIGMEDNIALSRLIFQRGKLKVLEELLDRPEKEYSIRQLSKESGASYDLTHRFVGKLSELGIVKEKKIGGAVIIELNERSPYVDKLKELVKIDFKPLIEKAKEFAKKIDEKEEGIKAAILFGSVSRGTPKIGSDVDILILADENTSAERKEEIESYANKIASRYEREEKITFVPIVDSFDSFKDDLETEEPFALEVKKEGIKLQGESPW